MKDLAGVLAILDFRILMTSRENQEFSWVEISSVRVKCLAQEHYPASPAGLLHVPGPKEPGLNKLTIRTPCPRDPYRISALSIKNPLSSGSLLDDGCPLKIEFVCSSNCVTALGKCKPQN